MRCPKCGYISFDRQKSCGKCSNDLTAVAEQLQGTASKAAPPFFLSAVLGKQHTDEDEPEPAFHEEEETFTLDELEAEPPPVDEDELDFAGAPLDEDDLDDQPLPSLGLEDIDVSDLMPSQEEAEETGPPMESEQEEEMLAPVQVEEDSLSGIEFAGFDAYDTPKADEKETSSDDLDDREAAPQATTEDDEIIDLSSLMSFDEPPPVAPDEKEDHHDNMLELSLDDEPDGLHLILDEGKDAPADKAQKRVNSQSDVMDLDLTLEDDDH